ncbi:MAG: ion channel [Holophaga sp.]|nr:ion channel [Holophaga sp.]
MPFSFSFLRRLATPSDDLGLGTRDGPSRGVNKDGSFNLRRTGVPRFRPYELYHQLITMSVRRFALMMLVGNLVANLVFAGVYLAVGMEHFDRTGGPALVDRFLDAFFFSTQTLTTVGNGHIHPVSALASAVAALESLLGLMGFALACGLVYGRFSRPHARILFSRQAVMAPYQDMTAFMFRIVNERSNQLIELEAHVSLSLRDPESGTHVFTTLTLERGRINLFPSSWTIVHPITEDSPLFGMSAQDLMEAEAEFIVLIKAFDDTFAQSVFARSSYKGGEIAWGRRFAPMVSPRDAEGMATVDLSLLDELETPS